MFSLAHVLRCFAPRRAMLSIWVGLGSLNKRGRSWAASLRCVSLALGGRLLFDRRLLHAAEAHEIHPQQGSHERVQRAHHKGESVADTWLPLEDSLDTSLLNDACHNLVPQVARDGHVCAVRQTGANKVLRAVGRLPGGVQRSPHSCQPVGHANTKHARAGADHQQLGAVAHHCAGTLHQCVGGCTRADLLEGVVRAARKHACKRAGSLGRTRKGQRGGWEPGEHEVRSNGHEDVGCDKVYLVPEGVFALGLLGSRLSEDANATLNAHLHRERWVGQEALPHALKAPDKAQEEVLLHSQVPLQELDCHLARQQAGGKVLREALDRAASSQQRGGDRGVHVVIRATLATAITAAAAAAAALTRLSAISTRWHNVTKRRLHVGTSTNPPSHDHTPAGPMAIRPAEPLAPTQSLVHAGHAKAGHHGRGTARIGPERWGIRLGHTDGLGRTGSHGDRVVAAGWP
mmetsp:Transcript_5264/g.13331  ORF Transcript_5264/g.13331 Transcript_5264/m.13331 type:complete len:460 (-) Transcript_5264:65-1444(-)